MGLVRPLLLVDGTALRVVAAHRGDEGENGRQCREFTGREEHTREARLDGNARELASRLREDDAVFAACGRDLATARRMGDGAEFEELAESLADHGRLRRIDERERRDVPEPQVEHREDDAGE